MLEIVDLSVQFRMHSQVINALEHVNLKIKDREKIAIIGESGSGKSVLALAILGLLPENAIVTGKIFLDGEELLGKNQKEMTKVLGTKLSYVPQGSGNSLNPLIKIGYQVSESLIEHKKITKKEALKKSKSLLKRFHLEQEEYLVSSYPHILSGGMSQRVLLALGIAPEAQYLIADEPTKGLDSDCIELVAECFQSLDSCTLLCVTHDLNFAEKIADRIAIVYAGQVKKKKKSEDFFKLPAHPYSKALLNAVPERGLIAIDGFSRGHQDYNNRCHFFERCSARQNRCEKEEPYDKLEGERMVKCFYADS